MTQHTSPFAVGDEERDDILKKFEDDFVEEFKQQLALETRPEYQKVTT